MAKAPVTRKAPSAVGPGAPSLPASPGEHDRSAFWSMLALLAGAAALSALSFVIPGWAVFMGTIIVAKSLVVLGLAILWRSGLVSFGQALFFGLGAYTAGLTGVFLGIREFFILVPLGGLTAVIVAFVLGFLLARYRGIFFANLILAFSMLFYGLLVNSEELGSTDGMHAKVPTFLGFEADAAVRLPFLFASTAVVAVVFYALVLRLLDSTLGQMTTAMRDNEIRVEYLGYPVRRAYHFIIVLAAGLAGIGGAMAALTIGQIDPEMVYWTTSGEFLFVTILAGTGNFLAPLLGTFVFEIIRTYANEYSPSTWQIILGGSLLLCILFLPNGLWSLFSKFRHQRRHTSG